MSTRHLENLLGAAAVALSDRIDRATTEVAGIAGEASAALLTIGTRSGLTIDALSRILTLTHSGTVRLVDRLQERGWVKRARRGGREVRLTLTRRGGALVDKLLESRRSVLHQAMLAIPQGDLAAFESALVAMLESLPRDLDEARTICRLCEHGVCRGAACPVGTPAGRLQAQ